MTPPLLLAVALLLQAQGPPSQAVPARPDSRQQPPPNADPLWFIFFDTGSAEIIGEGSTMLDNAALVWRLYAFTTVEITANTDRTGSSDHNMRLSARRARAVAAELVRRGIPSSAITLRPMGEAQPLVDTPDGVADAQNRYVQILLASAPADASRPAGQSPVRHRLNGRD